jgi:hypothetical protein
MHFEHEGNCILFTFLPDPDRREAYYDEDDGNIYIRKSLGKYGREVAYFHEAVHRQCHSTDCWCWKRNNDFWLEYHAYKGELLKVSTSGSKLIVRAYRKQVARTLKKAKDNPKVWGVHEKALRRVMRTKRYKELTND